MATHDRKPGYFLTKDNPITMGTSGTPAALSTYATKVYEVYTTSSSTDGSNSVEPFYLKNTMTGVGGVGGRAKFHMYTNVALGGWSNALKAHAEYGSSGRTAGLGSAFCAETTLSAGTTSGTYCALEGELVLGSGASTGTATSFMYFNATGAGVATFDTNGYLFEIGTGITPASGKFVSANSQTIKCKIEGNTRYMMMSQAEDSLSLSGSGITCISLGTCATGIDFTGTQTTAISTTSQNIGKFLAVGTFETPIVYTGDEFIEIHTRLGSATESKPAMRIRNSAPASTNMTTGAVTSLLVQAYGTDTGDVGYLEALQCHVGIKANCEVIADTSTIPNMHAAWFKMEDLGNDLTLTGDAAVIAMSSQFNSGTTLTGNADWISMTKEGSDTTPLDAFIRMYDGAGGGWANYLLDIPATAPIADATGETMTITKKIKIKVGGSDIYLQAGTMA